MATRRAPKLSPIKSGWLVGARYAPKTKTMTLRMKTGTYEYEGVTRDEYRAFAATFQADASSGSHFGEHFRGRASKKIS